MAATEITGSEALAYGALDAGVQFVTGYPGSPSTATVEALLNLDSDEVRLEWATNEKSAFDAAFGASLAGIRALLCTKSVGLNVALDSLMVANLAPGNGGFVILVGDDPGGWGSQNEQDSRPLVAAAEVPLLEPSTALEARRLVAEAFALSERFQLPIVVRITRSLALERINATSVAPSPVAPSPRSAYSRTRPRGYFERDGDRYNVLPIHVVDLHRGLQAKMARVETEFEQSNSNQEEGNGSKGIIAAGHTYRKLSALLAEAGNPAVRVFGISTLHPLPAKRVLTFLRKIDAVLILEETAPYIESQVQALAQRAGLTLPIYGRSSKHLPAAGEIFAAEIGSALRRLRPDWPWPPFAATERPMPSRQPLCEDCPYIPLLEALLGVMERHGGRDAFVVTGETGCMVRAQLAPWQILDVKYGMGSSIGLAAGLARTGIAQKLIALSGDSALIHSGLQQLIDASLSGVDLLVIILANQTTALSGGQPHPATDHDARGQTRESVDLVALLKATGPAGSASGRVRVIDPDDMQETRTALEEGLLRSGVNIVVSQRDCPR